MTVRISLDFETLSPKENAVLLSLGACVFDPATGEIGAQFYAAIDPRTQPGRDINPDTVLWWMQQDQAARDKITQAVKSADLLDSIDDTTPEDEAENIFATAAHPIQNVARAFLLFVEELGESVECWTNGAVDHAWLESMFQYSGFKNPIKFWMQRDYRTLKALYPDVKAEDYGVAHNALDDAIKQAKHLIDILQHTDDIREGAGLAREYIYTPPLTALDDLDDIPF